MINKEQQEDFYNKSTGYLFGVSFAFPIINLFFKGISSGANILVYFTFLSLMIITIILNFKEIFKKLAISMFVIIIIFFLNYITFKNTQIYFVEYFGYLQRIFLFYLPITIIITHISDFSYFLKSMRMVSVLGVTFAVAGLSMNMTNYSDYLTYSIYILPFGIFSYYNWRKRRNVIDVLCFIIVLLLLLLYGGRMSFFSLLIYMIFFDFYQISNFRKFRVSTLIRINLQMIIFILIIFFRDEIVKSLYEMFEYLYIDSRNITRILQGDIFSFTTREEIFNYAIIELKELNWKIYGLFGDRFVLRQYGSWIEYSHNFFIECFFTLGFLLGTVALILILFRIYKKTFKGSIDDRNISFAFICIVGLRLLVSGSFLIEDFFYLFMGFLFSGTKFLKLESNTLDKNIIIKRYKNE